MITDRNYKDLLPKVASFVTLIFYVINFFIERYKHFVVTHRILKVTINDVNVDKSTVSRGFQRLKMYLM